MALRRAYVIGSGPNGLTAAITLAQAGLQVTVLEAQPTIGGGARSAGLTLPGFIHDTCSAVHPMAVSSPVFASFPLSQFGLEWIETPVEVAHPLDDGTCVQVHRSVAQTASQLGPDETAYRRLMEPLAGRWQELATEVLAPLRFPAHPFLMARFGWRAPWAATTAARFSFKTEAARAAFAGMAAHSIVPLEYPGSAAFGWILALSAHGASWPIARGGSQSLTDALARYLESLGGRITVSSEVRSLDDFEPGCVILCDITPKQLLTIGGARLPAGYRRRLESYRYGPGVFKIDWALNGPIPWRAAGCGRSATVHIGGSLEEIAASERAPEKGQIPEKPSFCWRSPAFSTLRGRPSGNTPAGLIVTCPMDRKPI